MTLFQINQQYQEWYDAALEAEGELSPELEARLDEIKLARDEKLEAYALLIKNSVIQAEAYKAEKLRVAAEQKKLEDMTDRLKAKLTDAMELYSMEKFQTIHCAVSFRKASGVNITDEAAIPADYIKYEPKISKEAIGKALKAGTAVPGAELKEGRSLQVK